MSTTSKRIFVSFFLVMIPVVTAYAEFRHPGILHTKEDMDRMKKMVNEGVEPWKSGFDVFKAHPQSQSTWNIRGPYEEIGRGPNVHFGEFDQDANAAYQCAIMWYITADSAYADKAKAILNAWSSDLKIVTGADAVLMAGLGPFKMVNAAEILRYTNAGWSEADALVCERMFKDTIYPVLKDFALFANGNWDTAAIKTIMAIGVFCNDRTMFERGLRYYVNGAGNGRLMYYIINEDGQCQESGRDQQHTQLGLAHLGDCCEIAWSQGINLYAYADKCLLKGFEYTAKFNLGEDVPFTPYLDRTGKYLHNAISTARRGEFRAVFEQIYNHYVNQAGVAAPYTQRVAERIRPEGPGLPGADHPGFGTLLFSRPSVTPSEKTTVDPPAAPGGIITQSVRPVRAGLTNTAIILSWVASVDANNYTVKRATTSGGPYATIAGGITSETYTDKSVEPGKVYYYVVSAFNSAGESSDGYEASISAGLPAPWAHQDVGSVAVSGGAEYDGCTFTLEGAGTDIGGNSDKFHFAYVLMTGDGTITVRFVPQVSSQFSKMGLMMRESLTTDSAHASLLLAPVPAGSVERPGWNVSLVTRVSSGADTSVVGASPNLSEPYVTYGRLMLPYWLRLERMGSTFTASISPDGNSWTQVGTSTMELSSSLFVGLSACSRLTTVTTTVRFDNVEVSSRGYVHSYLNSSEEQSLSRATSRELTSDEIKSPDGKVVVDFLMQTGGVPAYRVEYLCKPILLESRLGFEPNFTDGFELTNTFLNTHIGQWTNEFGERKIIPDNYSEMNVDLKHESGRLLRITFRAYNEGAALRYSFPQQTEKEFTFTGERTEFRFPENTYAYEAHGTEDDYRCSRIGEIQPYCERPLTLEYANGLFACLAEAANIDYPRMMLSGLPGVPGALVSALGGTTSNTTKPNQRHGPNVTVSPPFSTPWRMFVVGEKPGDLLERNFLMLNLNPPLALKDTSWIKPGKVMRDTTLTTDNSKAIIDFAETGGLQYIHLDWKWYGTEDFETGDATTVRVPNLDIAEIVRYGREKNVGLIIYVDRRQIKKQRDVIFPLYEQWGIKGVKIGFVDVGPQEETAWITETIQKAAEYHLMLNIHDGYRPTGNNRTYPNLMTVEGIRGNEHMPAPEHNCTLPFTRYIAGIGDYTVCYYDKRLKTTHAHQLAMAVVSFSPLQWIFWYDRPSMYQDEPEVEFFRKVPTIWDDTKVIHGEIGKYASIARRNGDDWFIGTINNSEPRQLQLPLTFLAESKSYIAHIYSDDDSIQTRTKVGIETRQVDSKTNLEVSLHAAGGQAVWITLASNQMQVK